MAPHITKVFGGPGTGKTTRMVEIVQHELANGVPASKIAFLSYSRAAADEAWHRVSKAEGYKGRQRPQWFCTIHAACRRSIQWPARKMWRSIHDEELNKVVGRPIAMDNRERQLSYDFEVDPSLQIINLASAKRISIEEAMPYFPHANVTLADVIEVDAAIKKLCKLMDVKVFDDLLTDYISSPEPIPVRVMIIDEAQDLTRLQWDVVHEMWKECERVYICGDDDQTIYTFTGAEARGFLEHPCDKEEVLPVSWRVPRVVGQYADRIISNVEQRKVKDIKWSEREGELVSMDGECLNVPIDENEKTLILCRHQMIAYSIYKKMLVNDMHVGLNAWSIYDNSNAMAVKTFFRLRDGETIKRAEAVDMLYHMTGKAIAMERLMETRGTDRFKHMTKDDFDINWDMPVWRLFGRERNDQENYYWLSRMIQKKGEGVVGKPPPIRAVTMHASKGQEADHVIIVPECYNSVVVDQLGQESDKEARLSYVAATRTKRKLTLLTPSTKNHMRFFAETPM